MQLGVDAQADLNLYWAQLSKGILSNTVAHSSILHRKEVQLNFNGSYISGLWKFVLDMESSSH